MANLSATIANDFGPEHGRATRSGEGVGIGFNNFGWEKV
jgi:hypothetical protein